MAEGVWTSNTCQGIKGFPKILYTTTQWLGIREVPVYEGREFIEHDTERCEVIVYIGKSENSTSIDGWSTTTIGFRFPDAYQAVARKALRLLCQIYAGPLAHTPMRFFPPSDKDTPFWRTRLEALQGRPLQAIDPTVVSLATYLLALDEHHEKLASELRKCVARAEGAEAFIRKLHVSLAMARAETAAAESRETVTAEAMWEAGNRYTKQLREAYLVTRDQRRMSALDGQHPSIPRGIPIYPWERESSVAAPQAPPPTPIEASEVESPLPCTQPKPAREFQESSREAICLEEVD